MRAKGRGKRITIRESIGEVKEPDGTFRLRIIQTKIPVEQNACINATASGGSLTLQILERQAKP